MKALILLTTILSCSSIGAAWASTGGGGGGGGGGGISRSSTPQKTPEERAVKKWESGLKHRDKAAGFAEKAMREENPKKRVKLEKKVAKEYDKAARDFRSAIGYNPDMYQAYSSLGYALRKNGNFDDSLVAYNTAIEINPLYGEAIEYRGETYLGLNQLGDAKEAYMKLFRSDRSLADELMAAMTEWVAARRTDSNGLDANVIDEFASWVNDRKQLSSFVPVDSEMTDRWAQPH